MMDHSKAYSTSYPFLQGGSEMGELIRNYDWSRTPLGPLHQWPQSLKTTLGLILHSKFPMFLFWGKDLLCFYNDAYRPSLGNDDRHPMALGQPGQAVWFDTWSTIKPLIDQVMSGGEATWSDDQLIPIYCNSRLEDVYWTFSYSAAYGDTDVVEGVFVTCVETTETVVGRQKAEETSQQVLNSLEESPVAIAIIGKENLIYRMVNPFYGHLVGRSPDELVGKSLLEALPELAGQGFDQLLREVIETGKPFIAPEVAVDLVRQGQLQTIYVDLNLQPRRDSDNHISGVLVVAIDVTQQVVARKEIEDRECLFRSLVEESPVATCLFVGDNLVLDVANELMIRFFGRGPSIVGKSVRSVLVGSKGDKEAIALLEHVYTSGEPFSAMGAPANLTIDGVEGIYYFDFSLKPLRNAAGEVYAVLETAIEVTAQVLDHRQLIESEARYKALSTELDHLVQQRTEQLQASIHDLQRSNENLRQFAYIASHDLQEPLRKIQSFGDLLRKQYSLQLGDGIEHLQRMQTAAGRMSNLIRDLLAYSQISLRQEKTDSVSLQHVVGQALSDLELMISETGAQVHVGPLPTVLGDAIQLGQLFQNLLSNALKFRRVTVSTVISVQAQVISANDMPTLLKPTQSVERYHQIDVTDNGIGFEQKYIDRIFQVFQRLHRRNEFTGTGVGLAICEKVTTNHGGAITATSQPNQGTTFSVYLPC